MAEKHAAIMPLSVGVHELNNHAAVTGGPHQQVCAFARMGNEKLAFAHHGDILMPHVTCAAVETEFQIQSPAVNLPGFVTLVQRRLV